MTEPLNISHPFDRIFAGDPYDPNPATFPDEAGEAGGANRPATAAPPPPPPSPPSPLSGSAAVVRQLASSHTDAPSTAWLIAKLKSQLACVLPGELPLRAAELEMESGGLARKMMNHFLSGSNEPVRVDLNAELERNPQLREYLVSRIEADLHEKSLYEEPVADMYGHVWVPQEAYGKTDAGKDQQLALGGTYFEFQVVGSAPDGRLEVKLNVADHYFWSPSEKERPTNCLHVVGDRRVAAGKATEFFQFGQGTLIVNDTTRTSGPSSVLQVEADYGY